MEIQARAGTQGECASFGHNQTVQNAIRSSLAPSDVAFHAMSAQVDYTLRRGGEQHLLLHPTFQTKHQTIFQGRGTHSIRSGRIELHKHAQTVTARHFCCFPDSIGQKATVYVHRKRRCGTQCQAHAGNPQRLAMRIEDLKRISVGRFAGQHRIKCQSVAFQPKLSISRRSVPLLAQTRTEEGTQKEEKR